MTRPVELSFAPADADEDGICAAQAVAGAGDLTINGALASSGLATLDVARRVLIDSSNAGDTSQTITIVGVDRNGNAISEVLSANGTTAVESTLDFKEVNTVTASAAFTGNVNVGTSDTLAGPWIWYDRFSDHRASLMGIVSGTINWGVQLAYERPLEHDLNNQYAQASPFNPTTVDHDSLSSETTTQSGFIDDERPSVYRFIINSFSSGATLKAIVNTERVK